MNKNIIILMISFAILLNFFHDLIPHEHGSIEHSIRHKQTISHQYHDRNTTHHASDYHSNNNKRNSLPFAHTHISQTHDIYQNRSIILKLPSISESEISTNLTDFCIIRSYDILPITISNINLYNLRLISHDSTRSPPYLIYT